MEDLLDVLELGRGLTQEGSTEMAGTGMEDGSELEPVLLERKEMREVRRRLRKLIRVPMVWNEEYLVGDLSISRYVYLHCETNTFSCILRFIGESGTSSLRLLLSLLSLL